MGSCNYRTPYHSKRSKNERNYPLKVILTSVSITELETQIQQKAFDITAFLLITLLKVAIRWLLKMNEIVALRKNISISFLGK